MLPRRCGGEHTGSAGIALAAVILLAGVARADFLVTADSTLNRMGDTVRITVTARDAFTNPIPNYTPAADVIVTTSPINATGVSYPAASLAHTDNGDGTATISAGTSFDVNGEFWIELTNADAQEVTVIVAEGAGSGSTVVAWTAYQYRVTFAPDDVAPMGSGVAVTVTAEDSSSAALADYTTLAPLTLATTTGGSGANLTWTAGSVAPVDNGDGSATLPTGTVFDGSGQATFTLVNTRAERVNLSATEDAATGVASVGWTADHFAVTAAPAVTTMGSGLTLTLTARDGSNAALANYRAATDIVITTDTGGTNNVTYASGVPGFVDGGASGTATIPADTLFDGSGQVTVTISNTDAETITATVTEDTATGSRSVGWTANNFLVTTSQAIQKSGGSVTLTITARDGTDTPIANYQTAAALVIDSQTAGTSNITFTPGGYDNGDGTATVPALTAFNGSGQLAVTLQNDRAETHTVGVSEDAASGSVGLQFTASHFDVLPATDPNTMGATVTVTVTARDAQNNVVANYQTVDALSLDATAAGDGTGVSVVFGDGSVTVTGGPGSATVAAPASFDASGEATFTVTNPVAEAITLSVDETGASGMSGVRWTAADYEVVPAAAIATMGDTVELTLRAVDGGGGALADYVNPVVLTVSTDSAGPGNITYAAVDAIPGFGQAAGVATIPAGTAFDGGGELVISVTNPDAETLTITASEAAASGVGSVGWTADRYTVVPADTVVKMGDAVALTITARDASDTPIANYRTATDLTVSTDSAAPGALSYDVAHAAGVATIPADTAFSAAGELTVTITSPNTEQLTITATEASASGNTGVGWTADNYLVELSATPVVAGTEVTVTITARDGSNAAIANYELVAALALDATAGGGGSGTDVTLGSGTATVTDLGSGQGTIAASTTFGADGKRTFTITNPTAETITLSVTEDTATGSVSGQWTAGAFAVSASPSAVSAGETITLTLTALDKDSAALADYVSQADLTVTTDTGGSGANLSFARVGTSYTLNDPGTGVATIPAGAQFDGSGQLEVAITNSVAEAVTVTVDEGGGVATGSTAAQWRVDDFALSASAPTETAGTPITVTITALDEGGATLANYLSQAPISVTTDTSGDGSNLTYVDEPSGSIPGFSDNGDGTATIPAGTDFGADGQVAVQLTNTLAETISVTVAEGGATEALSLGWTADNFAVSPSPASQAVGSAVTATITVRDATNTPITDYTTAATLTLSAATAGDGTNIAFAPASAGFALTDNGDGTATIPAGEPFDAGTGEILVDVTNTRAEALTLTVTEGSATGNGTPQWTLVDLPLAASVSVAKMGNPVTFTLTAPDSNAAPIVDYVSLADILLDATAGGGGTGSDVTWAAGSVSATTTGSGTASIAAGATFDGSGQATFTLTNNRAETLTVQASEGAADGTAVVGWTADHFDLTPAPATGDAGTDIIVTITARDGSDNAIANYVSAADIVLTTDSATPSNLEFRDEPIGSFAAFTDHGDGTATIGAGQAFDGSGQLQVRMRSPLAETLTLTVSEAGGLCTGAGTVTWSANDLDVAAAPTARQMGQAVTLTLTARDANGDPIANYSPTAAIEVDATTSGGGTGVTYAGGSVAITDLGGGRGEIPASAVFDGSGQATVQVTNANAEVIPLVVTESGASGSVTVGWTAHHFVLTPNPATGAAGTAVNVTIEAQDAGDNPIANYELAAPLTITTDAATPGNISFAAVSAIPTFSDPGTGTATIATPHTFDASGQIVVSLANPLSETLTVTVSEAGGEAMGTGTLTTAAEQFDVAIAPGVTTMNAAQTLTLTALDDLGNPVANYQPTDDIVLDATAGGGGTTVTYAAGSVAVIDEGSGLGRIAAGTAFDASGEATVLVTNAAAETITLGVDEGGSAGSVGAGWTADHFLVTTAATDATAGNAVDITITAEDASDNPLANYRPAAAITVATTPAGDGTTLSFVDVPPGAIAGFSDNGDGTATIGTAATFDASGAVTIRVTNERAETTTIHATEDAATGSVAVKWAAKDFAVTPSVASETVGVPVLLTITALDNAGNPTPGYVNTDDLTITPATTGPGDNISYTNGPAGLVTNADGSAVVPAGTTFDGSGNLTVEIADTLAENLVVAVAEGPAAGSTSIDWTVGTPLLLRFAPVTPNPTASVPFDLDVEVTDQYGNLSPVTQATAVSLRLTIGSGGLVAPASTTINPPNHTVTIPGVSYPTAEDIVLVVDRLSGNFLVAGTSPTIPVTGGLATQLVITNVVPANPTAGSPFDVTIAVRDVANNPAAVTSDTDVELTLQAGVGVLGGTTAGTLLSGDDEITINGVRCNTAQSSALLRASTTAGMSLGDGDWTPFNVIPGTAAQLAFETLGVKSANTAFLVTVNIEDNFGNATTLGSDTTIELAVDTGTGSLTGTLLNVVPAGSEQTSFSVSYDTAENGIVLRAFASGGDPVADGLSNAFTVQSSPPTKLAILSVVPTPVTAGSGFDVTVEAQDAGGNSAQVVLDTPINLARNTGSGTLGGTTADTMSAGTGAVTITNVTYDRAESDVSLVATVGSGGDALLPAVSGLFDVLPGSGNGLRFVTPPSNVAAATPLTVEVEVVDAFGNRDLTATDLITLGLVDPGGCGDVLNGTTSVNAVAGLARFTVDVPQVCTDYQLEATSGALGSVTSDAFNVTSGTNLAGPTLTLRPTADATEAALTYTVTGAQTVPPFAVRFGLERDVSDGLPLDVDFGEIAVTAAAARTPGVHTISLGDVRPALSAAEIADGDFLAAVLDADDAVAESKESDNRALAALTVDVAARTLSSDLRSGGTTLQVVYAVDAPATLGPFAVAVGLGDGNGGLVDVFATYPLAAAERTRGAHTLEIRLDDPALRAALAADPEAVLVAELDPADAVGEADEQNNRVVARENTFVALTITLEQAPEAVVPGAELVAVWRVGNDGTAPAEDVLLTVPLPPQTTFVLAEALPHDATAPALKQPLGAAVENRTLFVELGRLNPSTTQRVAVTLRPASSREINLYAEVSDGQRNTAQSAAADLIPTSDPYGGEIVEEVTEEVQYVGPCGVVAVVMLSVPLCIAVVGRRGGRQRPRPRRTSETRSA